MVHLLDALKALFDDAFEADTRFQTEKKTDGVFTWEVPNVFTGAWTPTEDMSVYPYVLVTEVGGRYNREMGKGLGDIVYVDISIATHFEPESDEKQHVNSQGDMWLRILREVVRDALKTLVFKHLHYNIRGQDPAINSISPIVYNMTPLDDSGNMIKFHNGFIDSLGRPVQKSPLFACVIETAWDVPPGYYTVDEFPPDNR